MLNVGLGKAAMQSSTAGHGSAQKAVDGSTSPYFQANTCTMTDVEHNPWWYVNLLEPYLVQIVRIDFGTACCGKYGALGAPDRSERAHPAVALSAGQLAVWPKAYGHDGGESAPAAAPGRHLAAGGRVTGRL